MRSHGHHYRWNYRIGLKMTQFIDTHNHVGIAPISEALGVVLEKTLALGIEACVITTATVEDFDQAARVARRLGWGYCVGLHPLYIREQYQSDLVRLKDFVKNHIQDPYLVGIGEIGLDFFVEGLDRQRQQRAFEAQLQLAQETGLAVSLHSRRALYRVMECLNQFPKVRGVLHAFAGSVEQAQQAIEKGFYLGFGGAMTFEGSKRVRKVAAEILSDAIVLETDAPDMPPSFAKIKESSPLFLPLYLEQLSALRNENSEQLGRILYENSLNAFPRLRTLLTIRKNFVSNH